MQNLFKQEHPKGLYLLFFVEMWERFSFYGMRALLVLYMVQGLMFSAQKAGNIYGIYTGLVYLTPLIGGYLADRYFGQRKCITAGAVLMSFGLFILAFGPKSLFLLSLFLMICANGCFKSNISSVLGLLYGDDNSKKDSAFTIFYMGINLGALLSPLVCGTLAIKFGFVWGFASAGIGMLIGLFLYKISEDKFLGDKGLLPVQKEEVRNVESEENGSSKFTALVILMLFTIPFWICFEQAGSSLTLFAEYQTNRVLFGHEIPTGYFQSLNPMFIILLAPLMSGLWGWLSKQEQKAQRDISPQTDKRFNVTSKLDSIYAVILRCKPKNLIKLKEPTSVEKFAIALLLMSISYVIMIFAGKYAETSLISPLWLVAGYFVMTVSELCLSPIGLSLVSKLAPRRFLSLTMGCWFLTCFIGDTLAGFWGGKYETLSAVQLFTPLAVLSFTAFLILLFLIPRFNKMLKM